MMRRRAVIRLSDFPRVNTKHLCLRHAPAAD
jgi:hypothetical protein